MIGRKLQDNEYVILFSQSCSVVSQRGKPTKVEFISARTQAEYNARSPTARGKDVHKLEAAVTGLNDVQCLVCDIDDRYSVGRSMLAVTSPTTALTVESPREIASWLARYYTRIALPDALVLLLREHVFKSLEKWLRKKIEAKLVHDSISQILIRWKPDEEAETYEVEFILLTDEDAIIEDFDTKFREEVIKACPKQLAIKVLDCQLRAATTLQDLDGYHRLTEYDYFTNLGEWDRLELPEKV